jgi:hypothetical protein
MPKPEYALQKTCVDYLARCVPQPPVGPAWTAINPVPSKSKAVAGQSKALGMVKGWPDLLMALPGGCSVFVEFKAGAGISPEQKAVHHWLSQLGHPVYVITSLDEFRDCLAEQGIKTVEAA